MTQRTSCYRFGGSVLLQVRGPERLVRHFDREYGAEAGSAGDGASPGRGAEPDVVVDLRYGPTVAEAPGGALVSGGHKTARWRVALGPPEHGSLRASIALAGGPVSVALSLAQGWFVEALVAVALARRGRVALPSAAFSTGDGATVLLGRSGAGKTTLTARALADGRGVLSDDQVVLDGSGCAWRYPRRLRFYPDIRVTAPAAWLRLPAGTRAALAARGWVDRMTRGYVAPSLPVPAAHVGPTVTAGPVPVRRLVVVGRSPVPDLVSTAREPGWAVERATAILADQRARLVSGVRGPWADALQAAAAAERQTLARLLGDVPVTELVVPSSWDAPRAVGALEGFLTTG